MRFAFLGCQVRFIVQTAFLGFATGQPSQQHSLAVNCCQAPRARTKHASSSEKKRLL